MFHQSLQLQLSPDDIDDLIICRRGILNLVDDTRLLSRAAYAQERKHYYVT